MEPTQEEQAHAFTMEVCKGNRDAIQFCGHWYRYAHFVDDVWDTREDGRPTMSSEKLLEGFITAALLFNSKFFVENRSLLFPIVLMITNQYADSVIWEKSPIAHRRTIADVLRCCGNEMFFIVAMIIGGWEHARNMSPKIRETDWLRQHDAEGNPI